MTWRRELRQLLSIGVPMGLTQLVQFSIHTVDVLMVGQLGPTPLAAASLGLVILYAVFLFGFGPAMAVSPMVSHALGANPDDVEDVRRSVRMALWTIGVGVLALSTVFFFAEEIALALGQPPAPSALAEPYVLALAPGRDRGQHWYVFPGGAPEGRLRRLRVNFGAPGDRRDAAGASWLSYPRPFRPAAAPPGAGRLPVRLEAQEPRWRYRPSLTPHVAKTDRPWVYTSALCGPGDILIDLVPRRAATVPTTRPGPRAYTVRLHFLELEGLRPRQRVFNVSVQGREVLKDFDIAAAAAKLGPPGSRGARAAVVREFRSVTAAEVLKVSLTAGKGAPPVLCGIEAVIERSP